MEYMMVCTADSEGKMYLEHILCEENDITLTWLSGINGKEKELKNVPFIGTSINSIYNNKQQIVGLGTISSVNRVKKILNKIKDKKITNRLKVCIVPTINSLDDIE